MVGLLMRGHTEESLGGNTPWPSPALRAPSPIGWERDGVRALCSLSSGSGSIEDGYDSNYGKGGLQLAEVAELTRATRVIRVGGS
jgi:hypothetical protein